MDDVKKSCKQSHPTKKYDVDVKGNEEGVTKLKMQKIPYPYVYTLT